MRKIVIWAAALAAASTSLTTPAAAAQRHLHHHHQHCRVSGAPNKRDCLLQLELQVAQATGGNIQGSNASVMINSLPAFLDGRMIGFVIGTMSTLDSSSQGEGIYTLRLSDGQGQLSLQFAQLA